MYMRANKQLRVRRNISCVASTVHTRDTSRRHSLRGAHTEPFRSQDRGASLGPRTRGGRCCASSRVGEGEHGDGDVRSTDSKHDMSGVVERVPRRPFASKPPLYRRHPRHTTSATKWCAANTSHAAPAAPALVVGPRHAGFAIASIAQQVRRRLLLMHKTHRRAVAKPAERVLGAGVVCTEVAAVCAALAPAGGGAQCSDSRCPTTPVVNPSTHSCSTGVPAPPR